MVNLNDFDELSKTDIPLKIEKLYIKEINCKIPYAPGVFDSAEFKEAGGQIVPTIEISTKVQSIAANKYEVVLHAIVHGKIKNISLFVLDVQQAGIFVVNVPASQLKQTIEINCASYLHVYLSQAISNAIIQAGFPPIVLHPLQPVINPVMNQENPQEQGNKTSSLDTIKHMDGKLEKVTKPN